MDRFGAVQLLDNLERILGLGNVHEQMEVDEQMDEDGQMNEDRQFVARVPKRYVRDFQNPFEYWHEHQFRYRYGFSKDVVMNYLLPLIRHRLDHDNNRGLPVESPIQLIMGLRFYKTNSFQRVIGDLRGVSQSTACLVIQRVSVAFAELLQEFVHFPRTEREQLYNIQKFFEKAGMRYLAGAVDGVLIPIACPGGDIAEIFRCRKVVVGPDGEMLFVDARQPGVTHDQTCMDRSALRIIFRQNLVRGILIGDPGYRNETWILTPFVHPQDDVQVEFNDAHVQTRNVVEKTFGRWKRKFPCLKGLRTHLDNSIAIICALAVLWNIHLAVNYPREAGLQNFILNPQALAERRDDMSGLDYRRFYARLCFA